MKTQIVSRNWRGSLEELRHDIGDTIDRWISRLKPEHRREAENAFDSGFRNRPFDWAFQDPSLNIDDEGDHLVVTAELPGLKKEDLHVDVDGRLLTVSGHRESEREERKGRSYMSERRFGAFTRVIPLPCEVEQDGAEARYRRGTLRLTLPKSAEGRARLIKVDYED